MHQRIPCCLFVSALFTAAAAWPTQLNDTTTCDALGYSNLTNWQQRLDLVSPYNLSAPTPYFLPLYASQPLTASPSANATTALIFLHGLSGDANSYWCLGVAAAASAGHAGDALAFAPWFGNEQVTAAEWGSGGAVDSRSVFWNSSRWNEGGDVSPGEGPARWTTSFDVLDALLRNVTASFPSLQLVTMVGFSAGAQLASRYAWASPLGVSASDGLGVRVRFVVSDPGTFLYLDAQRPAASCRPLEDDGESAAGCTSFQAPTAAEDCDSDYDQYKYGLQNGSLAYQNAYLAPLDGDAAAIAAASQRFAAKDVVYIFGGGDVCNCGSAGYANPPACYPAGVSCSASGCCDTYPDGTNNALSTTCAADVQGSNRLQRGLLYLQHLKHHFGADSPAASNAYVVPGMAHDNAALYASSDFRATAYWAPAAGGSPARRRRVGLGAALGGAGAGAAALLAVAVVLRQRQRRATEEDANLLAPLTED